MMTTVVNIKRTKRYDLYIGRGSPWGNPFVIGKDGTRDDVIDRYRAWFYNKLKDTKFRDSVHLLRGKRLGCYCKPLKCHGDVIVEYLENMHKLVGCSLDESLRKEIDVLKMRIERNYAKEPFVLEMIESYGIFPDVLDDDMKRLQEISKEINDR
jgi:hypothetical protein